MITIRSKPNNPILSECRKSLSLTALLFVWLLLTGIQFASAQEPVAGAAQAFEDGGVVCCLGDSIADGANRCVSQCIWSLMRQPVRLALAGWSNAIKIFSIRLP